MNSLALRPYQQQGVTEIRAQYSADARSVLYTAPTGSGKTHLFAFIVAGAAARGNRVTILGHRQEIVDQITAALSEIGVTHGIIAAGRPENPDAPVQVASVASLVRRLDRLQNINLVVVDECHHAVAGIWRKILAAAPDARVLGVTATPQRLDGRGLNDVFEVLVLGPTVAELIEDGYLSRFTAYAPARNLDLSGIRTRMGDYANDQLAELMSDGVVIGSAVEDYTRLCAGAPAIAFCVDVRHSQLVAARFAAAGYRAAHVDGETDRDERRQLIRALGTGEVQVLTNCGLVSEGLDVPGVVAAILLRPTRSLALYMQQVGRALRPAPGKEKALILDHAANTYRFGLVDAPRVWSLEGRANKGTGSPVVCRCKACGALNPVAAISCAECGALLREPAPPRRRVETRTSPLIEIDALRAMNYGQALRWAGRSEEKLRLVARARGYKRGWVYHRMRELAGETA